MVETKTLVIIGGCVLVAGLGYWYYSTQYAKNKETFASVGRMDAPDSYDVNVGPQVADSDEWVDAPSAGEFADYLPDDSAVAVSRGPNASQRLRALQDSTAIPSSAAALPQFNANLADPSVYAFHAQYRKALKNPRAMEADPFRGDIPIVFHPEVCMVGRSQYTSRDSQYLGFFSQGYSDQYSKITGAGVMSNRPMRVMAGETVMD
jgi:hypothetical protein